jgi:hypothetical protein
MTTTKTVTAPKFTHDVTFCGATITPKGSICHRLPAHSPEPREGKGDDASGHNAFVRGNGVAKPKVRKVVKAAVKAPTKSVVQPIGTVVIAGVTYTLTPVTPVKAARKAPVKAARRPKVRVLPTAGPEGRDVQTHRTARRSAAAPKGTQRRRTEAK